MFAMHPFIEATPERALIDQQTSISVKNIQPQETFAIQAEALDDDNVLWISEASFRADNNGIIDLSKQAPQTGSYSGVEPMGLLWSMQATSNPSAIFSIKKDQLQISFKVLQNNEIIASKQIVRLRKASNVKTIPLHENGLVGTLFLPPSQTPLPVVVTFSGSSGGIKKEMSELLASHGFAVLALGYFGMEGLPNHLLNFPIEYFETAFKWIRTQDYLDGSHIGIWGCSRGGELSLILGSWFPKDIKAIVAVVPGIAITSGEGSEKEAFYHGWSYQGKPLLKDFLEQVQITPQATSLLEKYCHGTGRDKEHPATILQSFLEGMKNKERFNNATIPVEKIQAPLMLIAAGDDQMWPSELFCQLIKDRLKKYNSKIDCEHLSYPNAGHIITYPNIPEPDPVFYIPFYKMWFSTGGTKSANWHACQDSWQKLIAFFKKTLKSDKA